MPNDSNSLKSMTGAQRAKFRKSMRHYGAGLLRHGSTGERVTDPKMAKAIAFSQARKVKRGGHAGAGLKPRQR